LWWRYIGQEWFSATAVDSKAGKTRDLAKFPCFSKKWTLKSLFFEK